MSKTEIPSIRFRGFDDAWEQRKLGEVIRLNGRIGFRGYTEKDIVTKDDGGVLTFSPTNIVDNKLTTNCKNTYITRFKYDESPEIKIHNGDILFVKTGSTLGKSALVTGLSEDATLNPQVVVMRTNNLNVEFLAAMLVTNAIISQVNSAKIGGAVPTLTETRIKDFDVAIPVSEAEKEQIGQFFSQLDHLITLHQRKFEKLTNVKKSMLKKMFPQNGSSYPKIRFKGFTDPWEQRKFSEITFLSGEKNRENLPLESYSITNESGFVPQDEKFENGGTMREADKRMYYIVSPNSFAYNPARINVGSIGYQNTGKNVIVSSLYEIFKTSDDVDDRLLWHWFKSPDFQKLIWQLQEGGVRLYFYYDKLCMGEVSLPSLEEQRKIGKFFDTLDNLITLHQRELEKLQSIKKALLEKMFV